MNFNNFEKEKLYEKVEKKNLILYIMFFFVIV